MVLQKCEEQKVHEFIQKKFKFYAITKHLFLHLHPNIA